MKIYVSSGYTKHECASKWEPCSNNIQIFIIRTCLLLRCIREPRDLGPQDMSGFKGAFQHFLFGMGTISFKKWNFINFICLCHSLSNLGDTTQNRKICILGHPVSGKIKCMPYARHNEDWYIQDTI